MQMNNDFTPTDDQLRWARKSRYGKSSSFLLELVKKQQGLCAFSGVPLIFSALEGTAQKGGLGVHPLYAALDHCDPGNALGDFQIVCYALNDLKGHLSVELFQALQETSAWKNLMQKWQSCVANKVSREEYYKLLRPNASKK